VGAKKIYNVNADNERIGSYTAEAAEKLLGIPKNKVSVYVDQRTRYQGKYLFIPEDKEQELFELKWNAARFELLASGRKVHGAG